MRGKYVIFSILTIIVVFIVLYFATDIFSPPIQVRTFKVEKKDLPIIISTTGNLSFTNKVEIFPKFSAMILKLRVKLGDKVKKGDTLAMLDASEIEKQMKNIELAMEAIKTQEILSSQGNILGRLFGFSSQESSNNSSFSLESMRALLESYYKTLKEQYENRIIRSPISGVVVSVNVEEGQRVKEETQGGLNFPNLSSLNLSSLLSLFGGAVTSNSMMTIVDINSLTAVVKVDENNVLKIKEGQKAEVKVDALGEKLWEGRVKSVSFSPSLNKDGTYAYEVKIAIPILGDKVKEGMSVSANVYAGIKKGSLVIPLSSIIFREGKTFVFAVNDNHAVEKEVILGDIYGDMIEVIKGLKEEDTIIISPPKNIKNGSRVRS